MFIYGTASGSYRLVINGTLSAASWININTDNSTVQYTEVSATLTGGITLYANGLSSNRGGGQTSRVETKDPLTNYSDGSGSDIISIVFTCTSNGTIGAGLNWLEYY